MRKKICFFLLALQPFFQPMVNAASKKTAGPNISIAALGGFFNGVGLGMEFSATQLSRSYPFGMHFGFGYFTQQNSGVATEARKIFINDNTNGNDNIEKYGKTLYLSSDLSYKIITKSDLSVSMYGGARYVRYKAHFNYQGGNEAFDVYNHTWGMGGGLRLDLKLSSKISFEINSGLDYFFPSMLIGHGNFYSPDGVDDNPRNDYTYTDADNAINQPDTNPKIFVSLKYHL